MGFVPSKKQGQQIHTKRRARERYGVDLNKDDRRAITQNIKESLEVKNRAGRVPCSATNTTTPANATFLAKHSNRVSEWEVPYEQHNLRVLYDSKRNSLITCLPPLSEEKDEDDDGNVR